MANSTIEEKGERFFAYLTVSRHTLFTVSSQITVAAGSDTYPPTNGNHGQSIEIKKSGWYPLGIVGFSAGGTGCSGANLFKIESGTRKSGSFTIYCYFRQEYLNYAVNGTVTADILWVYDN